MHNSLSSETLNVSVFKYNACHRCGMITLSMLRVSSIFLTNTEREGGGREKTQEITSFMENRISRGGFPAIPCVPPRRRFAWQTRGSPMSPWLKRGAYSRTTVSRVRVCRGSETLIDGGGARDARVRPRAAAPVGWSENGRESPPRRHGTLVPLHSLPHAPTMRVPPDVSNTHAFGAPFCRELPFPGVQRYLHQTDRGFGVPRLRYIGFRREDRVF